MYNFLDHKLLPKAKCLAPSMDNYEIENIISDDYSKKHRGFLAYSSIKPPIDIDFDFICSVNIHYILINGMVGQQQSTGIELFIKSSNLDYSSVSKAHFDKMGVVFCNSRLYSNNNPPCDRNNYHVVYFKSNYFKLFLNATNIRLRIFKTFKSVPCLASVEVWGTVSKKCTDATKNTVEKLFNKNINTVNKPKAQDEHSTATEVPEDFKDDLTNELMILPMTLPSGKTIDQATLDKHVQNEKDFCRTPCDPFTGVKFTNAIKPILNVALKSRIDMFLLQNPNCSKMHNFQQTVGGQTKTAIDPNILVNRKKRKISEPDDLSRLIQLAKNDPNFVSFVNPENAAPKCLKCHKVNDNFYKLPCEHFYCRSCVFIICELLKCDVCLIDVSRNEIKKVNL